MALCTCENECVRIVILMSESGKCLNVRIVHIHEAQDSEFVSCVKQVERVISVVLLANFINVDV